MNPKISVLLPVYNSSTYVAESIESILNQSFKDFELIIIDGGSTDDTLDVVHSFRDERIRIIEHKERKLLIESLNEGFCVSNADLIARQDADDISHPLRLAEQYARFQADKNLTVLGTSFNHINEKGKTIENFSMKENVEFVDLKQINRICHGSSMCRKAVILKEGLYDPLFRLVEDYELWCRLSSRNYKIANLPDFLYSLRIHKTRLSERNFKKQRIWRYLVCEIYFGNLKKAQIMSSSSDLKYLYNLFSPETKERYRKEMIGYHKFMIENCAKSRKFVQELREFYSLAKLDFGESQKLFSKLMLERYRAIKTEIIKA